METADNFLFPSESFNYSEWPNHSHNETVQDHITAIFACFSPPPHLVSDVVTDHK